KNASEPFDTPTPRRNFRCPEIPSLLGTGPASKPDSRLFFIPWRPIQAQLEWGQTTVNLHRDSRPGRFIVTPCSPKSELLSPPASSLAGLSTGPRVEPRSRLSTPNLRPNRIVPQPS